MKYNYYNDNNLYCCAWLRNLIGVGLLPPGVVDERPIEEVQPEDLTEFAQCHFFAGIGGWSLALKLAGWPSDRPIWTGSCPCQPFSVAGRGKGTSDPRHLWPDFFRLIRHGQPPVCMGEQVSGKAGYGWLDGVVADLETEGYACQAADIPACSVGAPHIRNRLYWAAYPNVSPGVGGKSRTVLGPVEEGYGECDGGVAHSLQPGLPLPQHQVLPGEGRRGEGGAVAQHGGTGGGVEHPSVLRRGEGGTGHDLRGRGDSPASPSGHSGAENPPGPLRGEGESTGHDAPRQETRREEGNSGFERGGPWDDWVLVGPDPQGRFRRVKPLVCGLANGLSCGLDGLCSAIVWYAKEEIITYGEASGRDPGEVLRTVWEALREETGGEVQSREAGSAGVRNQLPKTAVLFPFLLRVQSALQTSPIHSGIPQTSVFDADRSLRGLRVEDLNFLPSHRRRPNEQRRQESTDLMSTLPLVLARCSEAHWEIIRTTHARPIPLLIKGVPQRVSQLRGLGNAIVPPLAVEVIKAWMETHPCVPPR